MRYQIYQILRNTLQKWKCDIVLYFEVGSSMMKILMNHCGEHHCANCFFCSFFPMILIFVAMFLCQIFPHKPNLLNLIVVKLSYISDTTSCDELIVIWSLFNVKCVNHPYHTPTYQNNPWDATQFLCLGAVQIHYYTFFGNFWTPPPPSYTFLTFGHPKKYRKNKERNLKNFTRQ